VSETHPLGALAESLSSGIKSPSNRGQVNPMGRKFLRAFAATLWLDPAKAAKDAGYSRPVEDGRRLMEKYAKLIKRDKLSLYSMQRMEPDECQMRLSEIGRGTLSATPQQVKSLELVLRVHGMLSDKVDVNMDNSSLDLAVLQLASHASGKTREPLALTG
jgi:hypothetical protein